MLKMSNVEYIELRNKTIVELSKRITPTDITKLQVQHIANNFCTIAIFRGKSIIRVALSKELSANMQLLTLCKQDKEYIFPSPRDCNKAISRHGIEKIIMNCKGA